MKLPRLAVLVKILVLLMGTMATPVIAAAQNSDFGLLLGVTHSSETRFGMQANYAWQFLERPAGRLYLELPVFIPVAPRGEPNFVRIYFTPGIRYHFNLSSRIALYAAAGGGIASRPQRPSVSGAFNLGGGVDYRLSRLWSLRVDARDLVASSKVDGGRNNPSVMFGLGFHF